MSNNYDKAEASRLYELWASHELANLNRTRWGLEPIPNPYTVDATVGTDTEPTPPVEDQPK